VAASLNAWLANPSQNGNFKRESYGSYGVGGPRHSNLAIGYPVHDVQKSSAEKEDVRFCRSANRPVRPLPQLRVGGFTTAEAAVPYRDEDFFGGAAVEGDVD